MSRSTREGSADDELGQTEKVKLCRSWRNGPSRIGGTAMIATSVLRCAKFLSACLLLLGAIVALGLPSRAHGQRAGTLGKDAFVEANGVRLHYVDWGGQGEPVVFLTGLGDSAHRFDAFAATLVDRFHVVGLTRRGQAESESPRSGYDVRTLVTDLLRFLDNLKLRRANFVGHSLA